MHHFIFANKDATIYNDYVWQNTGKDEILEIRKSFVSAAYSGVVSGTLLSRALVNFDITSISRSVADGTIVNPRFYLNMYICTAEGQPETSSLYIYPVSSSWVQGVGKRFDQVKRTNGVSWTASDGEVPTYWEDGGGDFYTNSGRIVSLWPHENQFQNTGHYTYEMADLRADITSIVNMWISGAIDNNGLLLKRSNAEENDSKYYGSLKFFSTDTNTIYNPKLEVAWDDSSINTGSLTQSQAEDLHVYMRSLNYQYNNRDKVRLYVESRPKYPTKTYTTTNPYVVSWYLPTSSYYSIVDSQTEETLVPFDTSSTKLSCNTTGNYFNLWLNGFHPERYYRVKIKVVSGSLEQVFEMKESFKVVR